MHFSIFVPGLLWPDPILSDTVVGLDLPALQTLLGKGHATRRTNDEASWWQQTFAVNQLPAAPLRLLGDGGTPPAGPLLCLDPVSYGFSQQGIQLADPAGLVLSEQEKSTLLADLTPLLAEFGNVLISPTGRWYLQPSVALGDFPAALSELIGAPAHTLLPAGDSGRPWRRLLNDLQIELHQHPLNKAREQAHQAVISSLALWGGGELPSTKPVTTFDALSSANPVHQGIARHAAIAATGLAPFAELMTRLIAQNTQHPLLHLDAFVLPTQQHDAFAWRDALERLEAEWIAPALAALATGQLNHVELIALGENTQLNLHLARRHRWQFWRRPQALTALHA